MSPTSYQAAPPRIDRVKLRASRPGCQARGPLRAGATWMAPRASGAPEARTSGCGPDEARIFSRTFEPGHRALERSRWRSALTRHRFAAALACAVLGLGWQAGSAFAAAEVHRFNLVLSASPTSVDGGGFNELI